MIMEPLLDSLMLHPALLIVSGFESITSEDVRFLNAYRRHFDKTNLDKDKTEVYGESELELGGILNPCCNMMDPKLNAHIIAQTFATYPYLTIRDIWYQLYAPRIEDIFSKLLGEIFTNLTAYSVDYKRPASFFQANTSVIRMIETSPCYTQIAALHMCGLGDKLGGAFAWTFERYRIYEQKINIDPQLVPLTTSINFSSI